MTYRLRRGRRSVPRAEVLAVAVGPAVLAPRRAPGAAAPVVRIRGNDVAGHGFAAAVVAFEYVHPSHVNGHGTRPARCSASIFLRRRTCPSMSLSSHIGPAPLISARWQRPSAGRSRSSTVTSAGRRWPFLDFQREAVLIKCDGLSDEQLR